MRYGKSGQIAHSALPLRGFTLIEMVVALALVALISVMIFESLRFGQRTYGKVVKDGSASWEVFASQRLVRMIVEAAYPKDPPSAGLAFMPGVEGSKESVAITAAAPMSAGDAGLLRYELVVRQSAGKGSDMVVRWRAESSGQLGPPTEEVLVDNIAAAQWSYQAAAPQSLARTAEHAWLDSWQEMRSLPALIRLRIKFPSGDSRRWPDLIMATRITDDANCVFDIVAQSCRAAP